MQHGPIWLAVGVLLAGATACTSTGDPEISEADYLTEMAQICVDTRNKLDSLPTPPEQISIADFATEAANALTAEAENVRRLNPSGDIDDNHRAFIRNTDEQAAAWRELSSIPGSDADVLDPIVTTIGELTLGRDDLSLEMGVPACQRNPG
jgi:hypothetical protein